MSTRPDAASASPGAAAQGTAPGAAHAADGGAHGHQPAGSLLALSLGALGVVFGDIGTSPLYALQECVTGAHGVSPTPENLLGVLSVIFWSLVLVVTVKYLTFLMRADNRGEGGIMALLALVPPRLRTAPPGRIGLLAMLVIIGAALLYGDGVITPAISVLSAVEGVGVATAALKPFVVPLTCLILFTLFFIQSRGTGRIGALFGPVMLVWFLCIGGLGVWHVSARPQILQALLPQHGLHLFTRHGFHGFRLLGSVVLTVTGGEALYADMGHFGRRPIQVAWLLCAFPALLLCYFGQGALLLQHPEAAERLFYSMVPMGPATYAMVALATAATVIASQALISGVFSLTRQAMQLGYFPRLTVHHTSGEAEGQIYLPLINWGLAGACIGLVLWAGESGKLAAAYGLAVSGTMAITSAVFYVVMRQTWGWPRWKALPVLLLFLSFDIAFLLANLLKFFHGGYLPFAVGVIFVAIMVCWRMGRGLLSEFLTSHMPPADEFLAGLPGRILGRVPGTAVCLASYTDRAPVVLVRLLRRFRVVHERVLILTVLTEPQPQIPMAERAELTELGNGFYRLVLRFGFMQSPNVPAALQLALSEAGLPVDLGGLVYLIGHESFAATDRGKMGRFNEALFDFLSRNARGATDYFGLPPEQVIELGDQIDL